jgi:hypothetical protein
MGELSALESRYGAANYKPLPVNRLDQKCRRY